MHIDIYGFREHPFLMTPDARLFFNSSVHSRAQAHLMYGLTQGEGFCVITGEVGAGKTTLVERFCGDLDPEKFVVARIMTTQVAGDDLLRLVADAFHVGADGLEELRMLSNITDGGRALLQTILLGQPQLRKLIASPDLDQLRQRILASFHLGGLSKDETRAYVEHRLTAVGWTGNPSWDDRAFDVIYRHTTGIPRRINRLCSRVLLAGALEKLPHISAEMVDSTAMELEEDLGGGLLREAAFAPGLTRLTPEIEERMEALAQRIDSLERTMARRERAFTRLMDFLSELTGPRR
jgi:type II secretory pathway predicted ATPase ExeA